MSKHTPGPWDFSWHIQPNGCPTVGHKGLMVCMVAHSAKDPSQKEEALANASLIAAAPDLLEVLEEAMSMLGERLMKDTFGYEWFEKSRAAISRAKGETV